MSDRIQRKRTKGWRMPPGAIYVGRPSVYGNPVRVTKIFGPNYAVMTYLNIWQKRLVGPQKEYWLQKLEVLRGHDLACWCALDQICHADVLLALLDETQQRVPAPNAQRPGQGGAK